METAAAAAPEAPAMSTVALLDVVAATPKIRPKIETVPSSIPNTMVPAELISERRSRCKVDAIVIVRPFRHGWKARPVWRLSVPPGHPKTPLPSIAWIVATDPATRPVPPTCLLIKLAPPGLTDRMESWLAGGWGEACVALTLIPRFTCAGGVESRSQVRRVAHACSGMQCHEPPPLICRLFGIVSRANAVRVHRRLRAARSRARNPAQIRRRARRIRAALARLVARLSLARAHQPDRGGAGRQPRHRRRHRTHHAGRRTGQDHGR